MLNYLENDKYTQVSSEFYYESCIKLFGLEFILQLNPEQKWPQDNFRIKSTLRFSEIT